MPKRKIDADAESMRLSPTPTESEERRLPEYENPPIHETVLAVQFEPLESVFVSHLGVFLAGLKEDWSPFAETQAIGQVSPPDRSALWGQPAIQFQLATAPGVRLRARDVRRERMFQIENGWLVLNWRGQAHGGQYPRYEALKSQFDALLGEWQQFLENAKLGVLRPNMWEVSYVNLVDRNSTWAEVRDWPGVFPQLLGPAVLPSVGLLQSVEGTWSFPIAMEGQLQIQIQHRARSAGGDGETMVVRLLARGPVDEARQYSIDEGFAVGHESIVRAFGESASESARSFWGYRP